jgi:hypothetical protein
MTEIERLEKALAAVTIRFNAIAGLMDRTAAEREIESILNPVEYEEVEESAGWVNVYQKTGGSDFYISSVHDTRGSADTSSALHGLNTRIDCQEIKVKVRREKVRPVERSWTMDNATLMMCGGTVRISPFPEGFPLNAEGCLTFTTTDPPK